MAKQWIVTLSTSMKVEAEDRSEAYELACDFVGSGDWDNVEIARA